VPYSNKEKLPKEFDKAVYLTKTGVDYGELNALIPVLLREGDKDTVIITAKEDTLYGYDYIENLLDEYNKNGGEYMIYSDDENMLNGALFKVGFFDDKIIKNPPKGVKNINKWLKTNLKTKKIKYNENYK